MNKLSWFFVFGLVCLLLGVSASQAQTIATVQGDCKAGTDTCKPPPAFAMGQKPLHLTYGTVSTVPTLPTGWAQTDAIFFGDYSQGGEGWTGVVVHFNPANGDAIAYLVAGHIYYDNYNDWKAAKDLLQ